MIETNSWIQVADLVQKIRQEYRTGKQALAQLDGKPRDELIARKTEVVCDFVDQLADFVGMQRALGMLSEVIKDDEESSP